MAAIISAQCAARVAPTVSGARKSAFSGKAVQARSVSLSAPRAAKLTVRAADAPRQGGEEGEEGGGEALDPPQAQPQHPLPHLRRFHRRSPPQGSGTTRIRNPGRISLAGRRILPRAALARITRLTARDPPPNSGRRAALTPSPLEGVVCALRGPRRDRGAARRRGAGGGASPDRCKLERGYAPNGTLTETSLPSFSSTG